MLKKNQTTNPLSSLAMHFVGLLKQTKSFINSPSSSLDKWVFLCLCIIPLHSTAGDDIDTPTIRVIRAEKIGGGVEIPNGTPIGRMLNPLSEKAYSFKDGIYTSVVSRISLRVPRIENEKFVDIREAVPFSRADGSPATTHVMFDPDGTKAIADNQAAQSTVIVTRLRDDRPKDAISVLATLDGGERNRSPFASRGITYYKTTTQLGHALHRTVRNRAYTPRFPYDLGQLNDSATKTYGLTTFVVVGTDSLIEFSQLIPCNGRSDQECLKHSVSVHQNFLDGVTQFLTYPDERTQSIHTQR